MYTLSDGKQARKINGIWYFIILEPIKGKHIYTTVEETLTDRKVTEYVHVNDIFGTAGKPQNFVDKYGGLFYALAKHPIGTESLKKYGLQND